MTQSKRRGDAGEAFAAQYLIGEGWDVCARNYHCRYGEIDLIAQKDGLLAFVEVKTRSRGALTEPVCAVTAGKRRKIVLSAEHFLLSFPEYEQMQPRFDIAEVFVCKEDQLYTIRYWPGAYTLDDLKQEGRRG